MPALRPHARVLLIRLSALGDVLFALETVASLKAERPDVTIDFLVEDRFASLLAGHPQIDRVLAFPRRRKRGIPRFWRELRQVRYDAALDLHGILKSVLQLRVARADRKLGFAAPPSREGAHRWTPATVALPDPLPHRAEWGLHLLRALGLRGEPARAQLGGSPTAVACWGKRRGARIVLHPGTSDFAAFKRWPIEKHAELARRLMAAGHEVVVSHGPGELALVAPILAAAPGLRTFDGGELGLLGLAAAYSDADLLVAPDTGPLHIAAAVGCRTVALFGPKDPCLYAPRTEHELLFHDVPCRPCKRRRCVSPQCVLGISVDDVEAAVQRALRAACPA